MRIVVVDGASEDETRAIVDRHIAEHPHMYVLTNPRRTAPTSLNLGIRAGSEEVIIRVDGHCELAPDYVERCVALLAASRAGNVGGLMRPVGHGAIGRAVAAAMSSPFGVGNARFHYLERETYVDTVYLGCFRREVLEEVGLFDEDLTRNQDDELNYRIRRAGYGILLSPEIVSTYTPRGTLSALWRQFYQFGLWKVRVMQKHPGSIQPRHLAPPVFVLAMSASLLVAGLTRRLRFLALPALYTTAVVAASTKTGGRTLRSVLALLLVFPCLHISYGSGILIGCLRALVNATPRGRSRWRRCQGQPRRRGLRS
jgi:GT2 family glycosyltransferase